jgi:hypothetical protein
MNTNVNPPTKMAYCNGCRKRTTTSINAGDAAKTVLQGEHHV